MPVVPYRRRLYIGELPIVDFSGGWNIRDAPTEIAENESPDCFNITLDERGGVAKRLGRRRVNATQFAGGLVKNTFYWAGGVHTVTQAGASLYRDNETTARLTFSTSARCGFADFAGSVWAIHPVDGLFVSTDAVSWTAVPSSPKGTSLLPSKNRLIACGDPANPALLYGSAPADGTDWSTASGHGWTNQIREVDGALLQAMNAVGGEDVLGRPGFLLFKQGSFYRVYDSDTGAYTTMDATVGAASPLATVGVRGRVVWISTQGVFWSDGVSEGAREASERLLPLFQQSRIAFDQAALFCAGAKGDRVKFSLPLAGSTANDLSLEYHPQQGWIVPGSDAASCYTTYRNQTEKLYAGSPTLSGQLYELGTTGTDDSDPTAASVAAANTAIACRYQTKWFSPRGGVGAIFRRARVFGRGVFDLATKLDFDTGTGTVEEVSLGGGALVWDEGLWDEGLWAPVNYEDSTDLWSLGHGTHVSFVLSETSTASSVAPALLGTGSAPEVGAVAMYGLLLQHVPIGL